jgi:hypothetical protein
MTTYQILDRLERGEILLRDTEKTYFFDRETCTKEAVYHDNLYTIREYLEIRIISDDLVRIIPCRETKLSPNNSILKKQYNSKEVREFLKKERIKNRNRFKSYR